LLNSCGVVKNLYENQYTFAKKNMSRIVQFLWPDLQRKENVHDFARKGAELFNSWANFGKKDIKNIIFAKNKSRIAQFK
jgi:hypothetical protein